MKTVRHIRISDIIPGRDTILRAQGIASGAKVKSEIIAAADDAIELFSRLARPIAVVSDISRDRMLRLPATRYRPGGNSTLPRPYRLQ